MHTDTQFKARVPLGSLHSLTTTQGCLPNPTIITITDLKCLSSPRRSPCPLFYKISSNLMTCRGAFRYGNDSYYYLICVRVPRAQPQTWSDIFKSQQTVMAMEKSKRKIEALEKNIEEMERSKRGRYEERGHREDRHKSQSTSSRGRSRSVTDSK